MISHRADTSILFMGGDILVWNRTDKTQGNNSITLYNFGNTNTYCRKCTEEICGLTICMILHPLIDVGSYSCTLAEIYVLYFSFKVLFHQLQKFVTDMKSILHIERVSNIQNMTTFFSSCHIRKLLQEGKLFTWGKKNRFSVSEKKVLPCFFCWKFTKTFYKKKSFIE